MAGTGETYARSDGKFAFRLKAGNGEIVATDGNQGYEARASVKSTLTISVAQGGHTSPSGPCVPRRARPSGSRT